MKEFIDYSLGNTNNFISISSDLPNIGCRIIRNGFRCQFLDDDGTIKTLYIRQCSNIGYIVYAHIPELSILEELGNNKLKLLKFLSQDKLLTMVYKNSVSPQKETGIPAFEKITNTFDETPKKESWVIRECMTGIFSIDTLKWAGHENEMFIGCVNEIIHIYNAFLRVTNMLARDYSCEKWVLKDGPKDGAQTIEQCKKSNLFPDFIQHLNTDNTDSVVINLFKEKGIVVFSDKWVYTYGDQIYPEDYKKNLKMWVKAEIFSPKLKGENYLYEIDLELFNENGNLWKPRIKLGPIGEFGSKVFDNAHINQTPKIDRKVYESMKDVARLWFYSNTKHDDISLDTYVLKGKTAQRFREDTFFTFRPSGTLEKEFSSFMAEYLWKSSGPNNTCAPMENIAYLIREAVKVSRKLATYYSVYKKELFLSNFLKGVRIASFFISPERAALNGIRWINKKL